MVEVYDSHEQSERVKKWLQENGGAIVLGLVLAFGSLFGFKQWQLWESNKDQRASAEYEVMVQYLEQDDLDSAVANFETLRAEFAESAYTALAAMQMAKARIQASQTELAVGLLQFAMDNAEPAPLRTVARLRLARVYLDLDRDQEALALLNGAASEQGFEALFAEIRGDVAQVQGRMDEAADFYRQALDSLETGTGNRTYLQVKLDSLDTGPGNQDEAS
ncbi:MAG: tetratricopeptide repeat protein [Xanthomonadales bacterium]|nr:tetratricopeptide repeat protein [Gammaproteobacteria bacterium]NNL96125.1 tetratricopeptide repeat protein [Xanthomonadales bacterium]